MKQVRNRMLLRKALSYIADRTGPVARVALMVATAYFGAVALTSDKKDVKREPESAQMSLRQRVEQNNNPDQKGCWIYDNQFGVDLEGDGNLDAVVGYIGARPGGSHIREPTIDDQIRYDWLCQVVDAG